MMGVLLAVLVGLTLLRQGKGVLGDIAEAVGNVCCRLAVSVAVPVDSKDASAHVDSVLVTW